MARNTTEEDSLKWNDKIPYIKIPDNLKIRIIPPFAGAVIRFIVCAAEDEEVNASVYLDCYGALGSYGGEPYWEVYPYGEDVFRCSMEDTKSLVNAITKTIQERLNKKQNK